MKVYVVQEVGALPRVFASRGVMEKYVESLAGVAVNVYEVEVEKRAYRKEMRT